MRQHSCRKIFVHDRRCGGPCYWLTFFIRYGKHAYRRYKIREEGVGALHVARARIIYLSPSSSLAPIKSRMQTFWYRLIAGMSWEIAIKWVVLFAVRKSRWALTHCQVISDSFALLYQQHPCLTCWKQQNIRYWFFCCRNVDITERRRNHCRL